MIRFNADKSLITAQRGDEDDEEYARISGLAVPWDVVATGFWPTGIDFDVDDMNTVIELINKERK